MTTEKLLFLRRSHFLIASFLWFYLSLFDYIFLFAGNMSDFKLLAEGKTKQIFELPVEDGNAAKHVLIRSRDTLTAFNAKRKDEVEGKALFATKTTVNVYKYLNELGKLIRLN